MVMKQTGEERSCGSEAKSRVDKPLINRGVALAREKRDLYILPSIFVVRICPGLFLVTESFAIKYNIMHTRIAGPGGARAAAPRRFFI